MHRVWAFPWFCHELFLLPANESRLYHCAGGDPSQEWLTYQEALWVMPSMNRYENKTVQRHLLSKGNPLWGDWVCLMTIGQQGDLCSPLPIHAFLCLSWYLSHTALIQFTSLTHHENSCIFHCSFTKQHRLEESLANTSLGGDDGPSVGRHTAEEGQIEVKGTRWWWWSTGVAWSSL